MLLTDEGYKEAKSGRVFAATVLKTSVVEERGGHMEHIGEAGRAALETGKAASDWFKVQRKLLLDSCLDKVLSNINLLKIVPALRDSVCSYLASNRDRMDYKAYRKRGLLIGSGAIESAHRTVMQRPHRRTGLKRSGQRWSVGGHNEY